MDLLSKTCCTTHPLSRRLQHNPLVEHKFGGCCRELAAADVDDKIANVKGSNLILQYCCLPAALLYPPRAFTRMCVSEWVCAWKLLFLSLFRFLGGARIVLHDDFLCSLLRQQRGAHRRTDEGIRSLVRTCTVCNVYFHSYTQHRSRRGLIFLHLGVKTPSGHDERETFSSLLVHSNIFSSNYIFRICAYIE